MRQIWGIAALISLFMFVTGCEKLGAESNSSDDRDRLGAIAINLDDLVLDYVSCIDGDKTDWKYFTVPAETPIDVTFAFDNPEALGTVVIRKATGEEVTRQRFVPGSRMKMTFNALPGHYFLEIFCEAYHSEYTLEVSIPR
ncbi:MAG: hypothetical protein IJ268_12885 [Proteobacteria bacterium]|nr:hypothetical protein [Pseudomonadota bacterium]MBQ9242373.1 hypothetical protein [Pseudomonadota bacterium]